MKKRLSENQLRNIIRKTIIREMHGISATPNKEKLLEYLEDGILDPMETAKNLIDWLSDDDAHKYIRIYLNGTDFDDQDDEDEDY